MSAYSLSVFLRMFINNGSSLLHPGSILEMQTIVGNGRIPYYNQNSTSNSTSSSVSQYGLGWYWRTLSNGYRYIGHAGSLPGMVHLMLVNEQSTLGVIILTNGDFSAPTSLTTEIVETPMNTHLALFDCFETRSTNSVAMSKNTPRFSLIFCVLIFFLILT